MRVKRSNWLIRFWQENKGFVLFVALMLVFRGAVADWNDVPTGSMQPTIEIGDRILVNKTAYDISIPWTNIKLYRHDNPKRGDIIVFDSAVSNRKLVKRVVGVPGDRVAMENNRLIINGQELEYSKGLRFSNYHEFSEDLAGVEHKVRFMNGLSLLDNFQPVVVPEDHYLALGDNRDNSADSRVIGFIPRDEIEGRANTVMFSLNYDNYYLPRPNRFMAPLDEEAKS